MARRKGTGEVVTQFESSDALCRYMADTFGDTIILSFSRGKDSLASWLMLRRYFSRIIPYFMYKVPGISFVEESLKYYEDFFQTEIIRLPHPFLYRLLNAYTMLSPGHCVVVDSFAETPDGALPEFETDDLNAIIREDLNLKRDTYVAHGIRARDNLNRWASIKKHGPVNYNRRTFYPIYDFAKSHLLDILRGARSKDGKPLSLPIDYLLFNRTFDGLDYRFLEPIRRYYPQDFETIKQWFPLIDLEIFRMQCREQYYNKEIGLEYRDA